MKFLTVFCQIFACLLGFATAVILAGRIAIALLEWQPWAFGVFVVAMIALVSTVLVWFDDEMF